LPEYRVYGIIYIMNWRSVGENLNSADEALFNNSFDSALAIYHSILSERPLVDKDKQHYLFRRLALGYTAVGANTEARECFNNAFNISQSGADFALTFYDRGISLMGRGLFKEAIEDFKTARDAYGFPIYNTGDRAVLQLIEDRIQECLESTPRMDKFGTEDMLDWTLPVANRPGQTTIEILANWPEKSENSSNN
jgi:tetratricopeptide (TPR) repeat protein